MRARQISALLCIIGLTIPILTAPQKKPDTQRLGSVHFTISCSPLAQKSFDRAVAMLHSFEYEAAEKEFDKTGQVDNKCAMAQWGIAMAKFRQLWQPPTADEIRIANDALEKAAALMSTVREQAYISAIREFYRDTERRTYAQRVDTYSLAMEKIYQDYPEDSEAAIFYALSLLASSQANDSNIMNQQKATAILEGLFAEKPDHPGVAHYLIHAYDQPELAPRGLKAARVYANIAPSAIHALHMPSHIFVNLGLWQDSINSNIAAFNASHDSGDKSQRAYSDQLHAIDFIIYSALQNGHDSIASEYADKAKTIPLLNEGMTTQILLDFPARIAMERHDWEALIALHEPPNSRPNVIVKLYLMQLTAAARLGNLALARQTLARFQNKITEIRDSQDPELVSLTKRADKLLLKPSAWLDLAEHRSEDAVAKLKIAAEQERSAGFNVPAAEMLGDILLQLKRPLEALAAYEHSLKVAPARFNSLNGAAQAADFSGKKDIALKYYVALLNQCGESNRPELASAKRFLSSLRQPEKR
jgi:tetratricopeptide (TPR) repeat protein